MWYFGKGSTHFTNYIDKQLKLFICDSLGKSLNHGYSPLLEFKPIILPDQLWLLRPHPIEGGPPELIRLIKIDAGTLTGIRFQCDLCAARATPKNPIYTNQHYRGVDICQRCLEFGLGTKVKYITTGNKHDQVVSLTDLEAHRRI